VSTDTIDIIKRSGKRPTEEFTRDKLHASIVAACLSARNPEGQAESTARKVCDAVMGWLTSKFEVTSHDIRRVASTNLEQFDPDAAYLYQQHRMTI
jgi:transcriptional regulator NrdR family protein